MINVTRLLSDMPATGDGLRYGVDTARVRPVVVWNLTPVCNLRCAHCYYEAGPGEASGQLDTGEGLALVEDLAAFGVPVLLFSGGEPLLRPDLAQLAERAVALGIRVVLSTNGTLIDRSVAARLHAAGVSYVGVSLDGLVQTNDRLRGVPGAFARALAGIRHCQEAGLRVGLRFTLSRDNAGELEPILGLVEEAAIPRVCIYHLVYTGRGAEMMARDLAPRETRRAMDFIFRLAGRLAHLSHPPEVLTVDNHADAPYLYLWARQHYPEKAESIRRWLGTNGGNRSGLAIAAIDHRGYVYPDQFTRRHPLCNVRERPFSLIWGRGDHPLLRALRNRKPLLRGRCARCSWLDLCNGNLRARAEAATGDFWGEDPACYLTDEEIGAAGGTGGGTDGRADGGTGGGAERWTA